MGRNRKNERETIAVHGATQLPVVTVDSYNVEIRDDNGFIGDKANNHAFRNILDTVRKSQRKVSGGDDPVGTVNTGEISRKELDGLLVDGDPRAAAIVHRAVEKFAEELSIVVKRFLKTKAWRDTEWIVVGGGMRQSRAGEIAIYCATLILHDGVNIELVPLHDHPDEAGLIGAVQLAPAWVFRGHDAILAVDIGGTNIRVGVVKYDLKNSSEFESAKVWKSVRWRHADEKVTRDVAVGELSGMVQKMIASANKQKLKLAPFIGVGCPGVIEGNGSIIRGAQNLPGNWSGKEFHLPQRLRETIPAINGEDTAVLMHNDAVVQGLSQVPFMRDVKCWGILTIGTGLGNARFTNRRI